MKLKLFFIVIALLCICNSQTPAQHKHFEIAEGEFLLEGKPVKIYSGEMHYARIPKPYWRHRMKMIKAMGLNTIATYVFWNYHNPEPGVWDFKSGNKDLAAYIKMAQEEGLYVILRPGPYACAEWDFGGYPWFLQNNDDLKIRTNNQAFLDSCRVYINKVADQVRDLQVNKGGPIIMVQVENEFGSYVAQEENISFAEHRTYYRKIFQMLKDAGFEGPFFTSDGTWLFEGGAIPGVLPTANGEGSVENLKKAVNKYHNNRGPYMVAEFYPGWLDHWAEEFQRISSESIINQTEKYLEAGVNFNLYMAHGGTNFGFTSGANYNEEHDIQPDITSYDYDAPITEAGWTTEKYLGIRELLQQHAGYEIPDIPEKLPVIDLPAVELNNTVDFFEYASKIQPVVNDQPLSFEELGQAGGYVLYSKKFNQPVSGKLKLDGLRDYALVYVNGKKVGKMNRYYNEYEMDIRIPFNGRLDILVENMGRINYGPKINDNKKGIISSVYINDYEITGGWKMYRFPMDKTPELEQFPKSYKPGKPVFYSSEFKLEKTGDVFLNMTNWGKGIVFVNGHNLGRYWSIGPQQTLYLPGCWLKEGVNRVVIFEQQNNKRQESLIASEQPILDRLNLEEGENSN